MAQWIIVFTSAKVRASSLAQVLAERADSRVDSSSDDAVVVVQRAQERVEIVQENTNLTLADYEPGELAEVLAALPLPNVFRISYYRGTALLSEVLHAVLNLSECVFIDNDFGVIVSLSEEIVLGLDEFLAARGGRFRE